MSRYILLKALLSKLSKYSSNFRQKNIYTKNDKTSVTELDIINQYIFEQSVKYYFINDIIIAEEDLNNSFSIETLLK